MNGRVSKIERVSPREGRTEEPEVTTRGYRLGNPAHGNEKHHAKNSVYVRSLDEAAELIGKGYSLWMAVKGKRASLISPQSLRILRNDNHWADNKG